jgi:hypothetical protein
MSSSSRVQGCRKNATCRRHSCNCLPHLALFLDPSMLENEDIMSGCLESAVCVCVSMEQMTISCGRKNVDKRFC